MSEAAADASDAAAKPASDAMDFLRSLEGGSKETPPPELVPVPAKTEDPPADEPDEEDADEPDTVLEDDIDVAGFVNPANEASEEGNGPVIVVDDTAPAATPATPEKAPQTEAAPSGAIDFLRSLEGDSDQSSASEPVAETTDDPPANEPEKQAPADDTKEPEPEEPTDQPPEEAKEDGGEVEDGLPDIVVGPPATETEEPAEEKTAEDGLPDIVVGPPATETEEPAEEKPAEDGLPDIVVGPPATESEEPAEEKAEAGDEESEQEGAGEEKPADDAASDEAGERGDEEAEGPSEEGPEGGTTEEEGGEEKPTDESEAEGKPSDEASQEQPEDGPEEEQAEPSEQAPAAPPAVDPDPVVRSPHDEKEFRLSELIVASTGEALGAVTASTMVKQDLVRTLTEEPSGDGQGEAAPQLDIWGTGASAGAVAIDTGVTEAAGEHTGFAIQDDDLEQEEATASLAARPRRKRKEKSLAKEMVGIVLGGIAGVIMASYVVVLIKGDQANFLTIPLPGCPSTYKHCPEWWPQWLKIGAEAEDEEGVEPDTPADPSANGAAGDKKTGNGSPKEKGKGKRKPSRKPKPPEMAGEPADEGPGGPETPLVLTGFPSYTSAELGKALSRANAAFGCKECNSTGTVTKTVVETQEVDGETKEVKRTKEIECPACQGHPPKVMKPATYDEFCRLAELRTFVDEESGEAQLDDRLRAIRTLLETAGELEENRAKVAKLADQRLGDESRLEPGILLRGIVQKLGARGGLRATEIVLGETGRKVVVVSPESLPVNNQDDVLILGSIVEAPGMQFPGFKGKETLVVFAKECVTLPKP